MYKTKKIGQLNRRGLHQKRRARRTRHNSRFGSWYVSLVNFTFGATIYPARERMGEGHARWPQLSGKHTLGERIWISGVLIRMT